MWRNVRLGVRIRKVFNLGFRCTLPDVLTFLNAVLCLSYIRSFNVDVRSKARANRRWPWAVYKYWAWAPDASAWSSLEKFANVSDEEVSVAREVHERRRHPCQCAEACPRRLDCSEDQGVYTGAARPDF